MSAHKKMLLPVLLLAGGVSGCATEGGLPSISETLNTAVKTAGDAIKPFFDKGEVRSKDRYCDSLEESYAVTDNIVRVASGAGLQTLQSWQRAGFKQRPGSDKELEETVKEISKQYLWMPLGIEKQLGNYLHHQQQTRNRILPRTGPRNQKLYDKADAALKTVAEPYTNLPYQPQVYIVESDQINAEALPAGYIYVTRKATADLDRAGLELVLGHEVAHIAKRHTSKQIQERLVDTGLALDAFKGVMDSRSRDGIEKLFATDRVIQRFQGIFARYDQDQELQADACSIRGMVNAGTDPLKAREEYLRKRGTAEATGARGRSQQPGFALGFTQHPEDEERDRFFREAYQHHKSKNPG
jgi:hypothetical protein